MRVCAAVVTFNRKDLLAVCLDALQQQTRPLDGLLVVDNASSDGTADLLAERYPALQHKTLPDNVGGSGGFHEAMRWAHELGFDWVWVMDDDAKPAPDAVEKLWTELERQHEQIAAVCSSVVPLYLAPFSPLPSAPASREIRKTLFVGFAVNRTTIDAVGLPREDFFIFTDDTEYCMRIRRAGGKVLQVPASIVYHTDLKQHPDSWALDIFGHRIVLRPAMPPWKAYYLARNRLLVGQEYGGWYQAMAVAKSGALLAATAVLQPRCTRRVWQGLVDGLRGTAGHRVKPGD